MTDNQPKEIDLRCYCAKCEARTKETYRLKTHCSNCGWSGKAILRKGDTPGYMARCPYCRVMKLHFGTSPDIVTKRWEESP